MTLNGHFSRPAQTDPCVQKWISGHGQVSSPQLRWMDASTVSGSWGSTSALSCAGSTRSSTKSNQDQPGNTSFQCFICNSMILYSFSGRDKAKTLQNSIICLWLLNNIEGERIEWCISSKLFQNKPSKLCESISIFLINLFISQGCQSL